MQIHELNQYLGSLDNAYIAVDNGADTGRENISAITDPLNARIDNIITPGSAPSDAEVTDARLGANSELYPSLGDAIRGQVGDINNNIFEKAVPTMIDGSFINAVGAVGSNASFALSDYTKVKDVFAIYSAMESGYAIYYFDKDKQKLSAQNVSNATFQTHLVVLNPPANAVYFRFNDYKPTLPSADCYLLMSIPKENKSRVADLSEDLSNTKEMICPELSITWINNTFINANNGNTGSNNEYKASDFLDISAYSKVLIYSHVTVSSIGIAFYDQAQHFISGVPTVSADYNLINVPYNAYYIRFCTVIDFPGAVWCYGERTTNDPNFTYDYSFTFNDGHYINITNGNESTIVGNSATDYIKIYPNTDKLNIWSATDNSLIGMAFYNANKEYVSGSLLYTAGSVIELKTLNVPKAARYFRFSCLTTAKAYAKAYSPTTIPLQITNYAKKELLPFVSAKFICVGDSLTAGDFYPKGTNTSAGDTQKNYPYFLGRMLNVPITNAGKSGATPLSWWSQVRPNVDFADADTMILWLGTNGGLTDTLDTDVDPYADYNDYAATNTGTYCKIIEDFLHETTDGRIFLVNTYNSDNVTDTVINKIATKYNLPVFDIKYLMRSYCPELFNTNAVHRNTYGNLVVAEFFRSQMAEWWSDNISDMDFCFHTKENPLT